MEYRINFDNALDTKKCVREKMIGIKDHEEIRFNQSTDLQNSPDRY